MLTGATMAPDFASEEDLLDRLTVQLDNMVFLVGSALTAPARVGEPGVPRVDGVIEHIRRLYVQPERLARLDQALAAAPQQRYQVAFRHLQRTLGQDEANRIIRRCVLQARVPSSKFPQVHLDIAEGSAELCRSLELDLEGWHLPPAVEALGQLLASRPGVVLTSNFDPLVKVSVQRAGGQAYMTVLHSDGGFAAIDGQGTKIVHFHGDWFRSDTLHSSAQLGRDRPQLAASLAQLLGTRTLVVLGYGGWDDIFMRSLVQVLRGELAKIDVLWTFYDADPARLAADYAGLLANLAPGIERARVMLYKGIDAHRFLPRLARALGLAAPSSTAPDVATPKVRHTGAPLPATQELGSPGDSILEPAVPEDSTPRGLSPVDSAGARNPFQKAGTLAMDAVSYVRRAADGALAAGLAEQALLVVRGEFSIGKSSLLLRCDRYWARGAEAAVCRLDLMDMRIDDVNLFYDEFFAAVGDCYGQTFTGWKEISGAVEQRPLLLTIDEFSGMTEEVAQRFVPALHRLGTRHADQLRIVVTTRDPFEEVLEGFKLNNPNLGHWHTVEVLPFSEAELATLLGLLPRRAHAAALGQIEAVRRLSGMAPKRAQCLCFNLFKDELAGRTDAEMTARVVRMESYR